MACVYILLSKSTGRYYIGYSSQSLEDRLREHNEGKYENSFTERDRPWEIYHYIICEDLEQARKIERHLKKMKSRKYIEDIKNFPGIADKLLEKYSAADR